MQLVQKLKRRAKQLKSESDVLICSYKDSRTPIVAKILIGLTVGYLLSPIDLIPDFIPVLGVLDDLIIVPALIALSISLIPKEVLTDARKTINPSTDKGRKTNWIFAAIIICIWSICLFYCYKFFVLVIQRR